MRLSNQIRDWNGHLTALVFISVLTGVALMVQML